jgi:hypothetical protein
MIRRRTFYSIFFEAILIVRVQLHKPKRIRFLHVNVDCISSLHVVVDEELRVVASVNACLVTAILHLEGVVLLVFCLYMQSGSILCDGMELLSCKTRDILQKKHHAHLPSVRIN